MLRANTLRGFTMIELVLVIAISAILVVGLGAIVEVPRAALERDLNNASPTSADRLIARMEQDIRFSANIRVPDPKRAEIDLEDHTTAVYEWDGVVGGTITMTNASGTTPILMGVQDVQFVLGTTSKELRAKDIPVTTASVVTSSFTQFALEPGFQFSTEPLQVGMTPVDVTTRPEHACFNHRIGIAFRAAGLSQPASVVTFQIQLVRGGTANLLANLYKANWGIYPLSPDRSQLIASATVLNSSLPPVLSDFEIPMLSHQKIDPGESYFLELLGDGGTKHACEITYQEMTAPNAVAPSNVGLLKGTNKGDDFGPLSTQLWLVQVPFALLATETDVGEATGGTQTAQIPTAVHMNLKMLSGEADTSSICISFPCQNNIALVNQH